MFKTLIKLFIINLICTLIYFNLFKFFDRAGLGAIMYAFMLIIVFWIYLIFFAAYSVKKTDSILKALLLYISAYTVVLLIKVVPNIHWFIEEPDYKWLDSFRRNITGNGVPFLISVVITKLILVFKAKRNKDANMGESKADE